MDTTRAEANRGQEATRKEEGELKKKKKVIVLRSVKRNAHHAAVVLEMD